MLKFSRSYVLRAGLGATGGRVTRNKIWVQCNLQSNKYVFKILTTIFLKKLYNSLYYIICVRVRFPKKLQLNIAVYIFTAAAKCNCVFIKFVAARYYDYNNILTLL